MNSVPARLLGALLALVLWFSVRWVYHRLTDKFWSRRRLLAEVSNEYLTWIYLCNIAAVIKGYQMKGGRVRSLKEGRPALRVKARFADKTRKVVDVEVEVYDKKLLNYVQPHLDDVTRTVKALNERVASFSELEFRPMIILA